MKSKRYDFSNKVVFVTGASTGIGRSTAMAFALAGARVVVVDINSDAGLETEFLIKEAGLEGVFLKCDVANEAQVRDAIQNTVARWGTLDIAFNNAGIEGHQSLLAEDSTDNWDHVLDVNLKGVWLGMKYQLQQMSAQGRGSIVNCSSIAGLVGFSGIAPYVASKHGVIGLTKTAALEYAKMGIRVNAICPGVIQTPMIDRFTHGHPETKKVLAEGQPMGRFGEPEEIAAAVLWLSSDEASFVTGHSLVADGGWVAQ